MPTNLYGPGDNYHPENSHVIPALILRFHAAVQRGAESVTIWGTGEARREFLYVDDMAAASIYIMNLDRGTYTENTTPMLSHINVGSGEDVRIIEIAKLIAKAVGFKGEIKTDPTKPDGVIRKLMDSSKLTTLGWEPKVNLNEGLVNAYSDFRKKFVK
jgi:nucleoside-diphosphate-sugar epimerase